MESINQMYNSNEIKMQNISINEIYLKLETKKDNINYINI